MYHEADEIKTIRNEAPIPTSRLWDLLNRIDITKAGRVQSNCEDLQWA
jgi:hypothetical protein